MGEEDCRMINFENFDVNVILIMLGLLFLSVVMAIIRVAKGPTAPDRVVGLDTINTIVIVSMVIFGVYKNSIIYIDVAIVYALLSYISTLFIAKYLEGGEF
jgi:multicomponent Na+:H+ antiporter subunit F